MRCASCGAEVKDGEALYCARCGQPLPTEEASATGAMEPDARREASATTEMDGGDGAPASEASGTTELEPPPEERPASERSGTTEPEPPAEAGAARPSWTSRTLPVADLAVSTRRWLGAAGLSDAAAAAGFAFLGMLCIGLVLVAAAKLELPQLGVGDPLAVLIWIVIVGLAVLGAPIQAGDLEVSAIPLGALLVLAWVIVWAARSSVRRRDTTDRRARARDGAKVGLPFALLCFFAALIFRYRAGDVTVGADPLGALALGALWGALFGALGGLRSHDSWPALAAIPAEAVRRRSQAWYEGAIAGGTMLAVTGVLGAGAALVWIIVALAAGTPSGDFGVGDAAAALIYLAAFAPNVIVTIVAVSLGAPVAIGAQVTVEGRLRGPLQEFSLFGWGPDGAPWFAFALVVIPALAGLLGGFTARRSTRVPERMPDVVAVAAVVFAVVLGILAALSDARLGAGLVRERGFGLVAPDAFLTAVAALVWATIAGTVGWKIGEVPVDSSSAPVEEAGRPSASGNGS